MNSEVAFTSKVDSVASEHLLQHYHRNEHQEDLCFALWRPSTGQLRRTALIDEIILPQRSERILHGNASFEPNYLSRVAKIALKKKSGYSFYAQSSEFWVAGHERS